MDRSYPLPRPAILGDRQTGYQVARALLGSLAGSRQRHGLPDLRQRRRGVSGAGRAKPCPGCLTFAQFAARDRSGLLHPA
jgi:hypothetical protein